MRTGIDAKRLFFNFTGLGNYGRQFVHALNAGLGGSDEIMLFCPKGIEKSGYAHEFPAKNISVKTPSGWESWAGGAFWRSFLLPKDLADSGADVFYGTSNELPFGIHRLKLKKAVIVHDLIFLGRPEGYPAIDRLFYKIKTRYAVRVADKIIAVSEQTKRDLINYYQISTDRVTVIPPICDKIFYSAEINPSKNFRQSIEKNYCLNVGSINPRKNLLLAIAAYSMIEKQHDLDFVVVGTAVGEGRAYFERIKKLVREKGLENRVHFLGKVDKTELPAIYRGAKFMVYPSQIEGFGMPIAESLFCKTPVITTRGGCFEEAGGPGALYLAPNNLEKLAAAMALLAGDGGLRARLAEAGHAHVQRFRAEIVGQKIAAFHRALTAGIEKEKGATH